MAAELLNVILSIFANYSFVICFLSGLIGGIVWLLALAALAANGVFPVWVLITFFYIGIVICDIALFKIGQIKSLSYFKKRKLIYKGYQKVSYFLQKFSKNRDIFSLFLSKFLHGLYAPLIIYYGRKQMQFKRFLIMDLIINLVWIVILVPIGYFAGKGLRLFLSIENNLNWAILSLFLILVIIYLIKKLFKISFTKKNNCDIKQKIK